LNGRHENGHSSTQANHHADFSLLDRQRLIMWQRRLYEQQIDSVTDFLLPANSAKSHEEAKRLLGSVL